MVSGSWACTSITNPKSVGRLPLTSRHESPASSERITSQCFCMKSTLGRDGCSATWCTQWPTSAFGSGMYCDCRPRLIGFQVLPAGVCRIEQDRVEAHPAGARLPFGSGAVAAQTGELLPGGAAVTRAKQRGVFHPGIHGVRIGERGLEVPDALELPGMLGAVVPLVRGEGLAGVGRRVVHEFVALA